MSTEKPIVTFRNHEAGIESSIRKSAENSFAVTLRDTDADQVLPSVLIFSDLEAALIKAQEIICG